MNNEATIGSLVTVKLDGQIRQIQVVGSADVNARQGKISYLSPLGEMILGKRAGDKFQVKLPEGRLIDCEIIKFN